MQLLLVTDLDNTLVGDDDALLRLNQLLSTHRDRLYLIYATGRSYLSARRLQARQQLLEPDYWVTGVGTEIYQNDVRDSHWADRLSQHWDQQAAAAIAALFPELIPQESTEQNPWKLSFILRSDDAEAIVAALRSKLEQSGLAAQVIFSSSEDVDIVPKSGDKGLAMTHLRELLQMPPDRTLVCGDSGNDISLFQQSTLGVIVSNAQPELLAWHRQFGQSQHYLARSRCAGGILEALQYFELL
ncbi:sucrose-phosphate phosphatase [Phormidium tenue FACHB-886]|nr:sucrose-phosphate phosphatase [Phormidium tenue FACHB-886]